ncbi:SDR family oxidoreductase [Streptomyces sp. NPDC001985]|uniref:SDR family oxidoreductase n=1 Tax=Streptomyces sp. NPDC001985 TaxID=3154406 RepID=UPI0033307819
MGKLDGKVAMITGAARALGRSHAWSFAREGADLLLVDISDAASPGPYPMATRQQLEETARECRREGARVLTAVADVRERQQVADAVEAGLAEFGALDVLVNNAGVLGPGGRPAHELTEEEWLFVIDVNLNGPWRCAHAVLPHMVANQSGSVINIASTGGLVGLERFSSYVASKHGVIGLTKAMALEYGRHGIRVNAVCPSTIRADRGLAASTAAVALSLGSTLAEYERRSLAQHALPELVSAEDVAETSVWLAGDAAAGITGAAITVDAGFTAR